MQGRLLHQRVNRGSPARPDTLDVSTTARQRSCRRCVAILPPPVASGASDLFCDVTLDTVWVQMQNLYVFSSRTRDLRVQMQNIKHSHIMPAAAFAPTLFPQCLRRVCLHGGCVYTEPMCLHRAEYHDMGACRRGSCPAAFDRVDSAAHFVAELLL